MTQQQMHKIRLSPSSGGRDNETPPESAALTRRWPDTQQDIRKVYTLWFDLQTTFGREPMAKIAACWLERDANHRFVKVAEIVARDPDEVWALSQHLDTDWTEGPCVRWKTVCLRARSSAVGDVISRGEQFWVIAPAGFYQPEKKEEGATDDDLLCDH